MSYGRYLLALIRWTVSSSFALALVPVLYLLFGNGVSGNLEFGIELGRGDVPALLIGLPAVLIYVGTLVWVLKFAYKQAVKSTEEEMLKRTAIAAACRVLHPLERREDTERRGFTIGDFHGLTEAAAILTVTA